MKFSLWSRLVTVLQYNLIYNAILLYTIDNSEIHIGLYLGLDTIFASFRDSKKGAQIK